MILYRKYHDFMDEYLQLRHMSLLESVNECEPHYYLPHRGLQKEDSLTTKLRNF